MAIDQDKINKEKSCDRIIESIRHMSAQRMSKVFMLVKILNAYQDIETDGLRPYINIASRCNWLKPLIDNSHSLDDESSIAYKYRERLRPLFELTEQEIYSVTTEEITTFLILHEEYGIL